MYGSLNRSSQSIITENDSIVIRKNLESLEGGKSLDVTGFTPTVIKAGHVIIKETATGLYKPMPLNGGATAYAALPSGHTYAGILIATIETARPFAGILLRGSVNSSNTVTPFDMATILSAVQAALPLILFRAD